jgi:phosphoserine phosphatase
MDNFVSTVIELKPRVAAFDCDGTLWSGDVGEAFFDWELSRDGFIPEAVARAIRARHRDYKAGKVDETTMCGEMVTMHAGMTDSALRQAAEEFCPRIGAGIFPEMNELVHRLHDAGCEVWAVSSSNQWVIEAGMKHFGIPRARILAAEVEIAGGLATNRLVRVPSGSGKPQALREVVKGNVDAAFGNSRWDTEMLAMAKHAFAVNPNADLRDIARQRGWTVYVPAGMQPED